VDSFSEFDHLLEQVGFVRWSLPFCCNLATVGSSELDSARADTSVDEAVAATNIGAAVAGSVANVVVTLEEHVVQLNHLCQNVGLLLRGDVLGDELDIEQIAVREKLSYTLPHAFGLELGNGGKVSEIGSVEFGRVVCHVRGDSSRGKDGLEAELAQSSGAAWSSGGSKECRLALGILWIGSLHHLHDGLETTATGRLNAFTDKLLALSVSFLFSWRSAEITGVKGSNLQARCATGKATNAWLWAGSSEAAITPLAFIGHEGGSAGLVGPVDLLSWLEFWSVLVDVVKLHKNGMVGLAATARHGVGVFFNNHDAFVGFVVEDIVNILLFPAALSNGFDHANSLLDEERVHAREHLDGFCV